MSEPIEILTPDPQPLALSAISGVNVEALLAKAIDAKSAVEVLERLMVMRREARAEAAKEAFDRALAEFQRDCPTIAKKKQVFMNGKLRYSYAPLESIIQQVKELLQKHGFSYALDAIVKPGWVLAQCKATHAFGHNQTSSFEVPIDPDAYMNEAQKFASALTFAKRYAFCNAFGILTGDEDDDSGASGEKPPKTVYTGSQAPKANTPPQALKATASPGSATGTGQNATSAKPDTGHLYANEDTRKRFIAKFDDANRQLALHYAIELAWLMPNEPLEALELRYLPVTLNEFNAFMAGMVEFFEGKECKKPYEPHGEPGGGVGSQSDEKHPVKQPQNSTVQQASKQGDGEHFLDDSDDEWFFEIICPVPRKGMKRADYLKSPDTIGSLFEARHGTDEESQELRQRLWGFVEHYRPKPWVKNNGEQVPPSASDLKFRDALDSFADWFAKNHPGEKL